MDTAQTSEKRIVGHYVSAALISPLTFILASLAVISALAFPSLVSFCFAVAMMVCTGIQSVYLAKAVIETLNKTEDDEYEYDGDE
jgi:hypothetical protein